MANYISEDQIEKATIKLLTDKKLGYRTINCFTADSDSLNDRSNRATKDEVLFLDIIKEKALLFNKEIPEDAIDRAIDILKDHRWAMSPIARNREIYSLIKDGIPIEYENEKGKTEHTSIKLIDFNEPSSNDFLAVTQLWIKGEIYYRRPDIIIYINGIPLVFIELKNSNVKVRNAYDDNLTNYKKDIPQLFNCNAFCILSNAVESRVGSFTAGYEHFFNWLRANDEKEKISRKQIESQGTSLERIIHGLLKKERLLDYIENFVLYHKETTKIIAQNHQFIGVNKAVESFKEREEKKGKLGVFWHTQGSGKSFSMIFLSRKVFRKFQGNFTFVIVTDRVDLDGQIYRNFLNTDTVKKKEAAQPKNSKELREYLGRNMRFVFTLIQKFKYDKGKEYPLLSEREDIIVIVDEAHRSQYKSLAENLRKGLPNAQFFAFTGTPLLANRIDRDGKTKAWFGEYVSEYNFAQAIDDGATVPLFYQKRVPSVLIQNENLSEEFYQILEDENLDEKQQQKLENEFSKEIEVIKRDDRLETIAQDIVSHFPYRGFLGKGMFIAVDKFTAVKMYEKVQHNWKNEIKALVGKIAKEPSEIKKEKLQSILIYMRNVEMAVVVSEDAGEIEKFKKADLDFSPHREKLNTVDENGHDIEYRFKDPHDKLELVFVCAMWLTGFDAPTVSTLYLDKPMQGHTLMQTIARANRVSPFEIAGVSKYNGEVVDYYNVFRNMKKALNDYGQGSNTSGEENEEDQVPDKSNLFVLLDDAINSAVLFCSDHNIDIKSIIADKRIFNKIDTFKKYADIILEKDDYRKEFNVYENTISSLYEACKPEILGKEYRPLVPVFQYLRGVIDSIIGTADIDSVKRRIADLLDQSVITPEDADKVSEPQEAYQIIQKGKTWDLSKINFDKLKDEFKQAKYKNIEIADLKAFIEEKLQKMLEDNSTRTDFAERFQSIIDTYNSGNSSTENYFDDLVNFVNTMKEEDERHVKEGLTIDELELYDLIKKEKLPKEEEKKVKLAAQDLLKRLMQEHPKILVQDWFKDSQSQIKVRSAIEEVLDKDLPDSYDRVEFKKTCDKTYELVFEYSSKGKKWAA
ncbi:MAG: type I restriction endonuclease subunit R [Spirochaetes bacterium]|nr:type I restriction endonuclease subunit R [Spirochaetota bacterium]MBN2772178.1 type I restriction endonuclease subunit R [Spirochaetota bacterium]